MPNVNIGRVVKVKSCGSYEVFDMTLNETHNFFANGVNVHNCSEPKIRKRLGS